MRFRKNFERRSGRSPQSADWRIWNLRQRVAWNRCPKGPFGFFFGFGRGFFSWILLFFRWAKWEESGGCRNTACRILSFEATKACDVLIRGPLGFKFWWCRIRNECHRHIFDVFPSKCFVCVLKCCDLIGFLKLSRSESYRFLRSRQSLGEHERGLTSQIYKLIVIRLFSLCICCRGSLLFVEGVVLETAQYKAGFGSGWAPRAEYDKHGRWMSTFECFRQGVYNLSSVQKVFFHSPFPKRSTRLLPEREGFWIRYIWSLSGKVGVGVVCRVSLGCLAWGGADEI